jgi:sigma-54 dependent transcriptional regulator, acetoin dehydrogenase operon transcriptional activator AcoR
MPIADFDDRLQQIQHHERTTPWIIGGRDEAPLLRSWQRSREAGLQEADRVEFDLIGRARLAELSDCHGDLARLAGPELDRLGHALHGSGTAVVLFDPQGTVIDRRCHEASAPAALRVATRVGVNLSERCVGTTAPAIALAEGLPWLVGRDAHFCDNVRPFE